MLKEIRINSKIMLSIFEGSVEQDSIYVLFDKGSGIEDVTELGYIHVLEHTFIQDTKILNRIFARGYTDYDKMLLEFTNCENKSFIRTILCYIKGILEGKSLSMHNIQRAQEAVIKEIQTKESESLYLQRIISFLCEEQQKTLPIGSIESVGNLVYEQVINCALRFITTSKIYILLVANCIDEKTINWSKELLYNFNLRATEKNKKKMWLNRNEVFNVVDRSEYSSFQIFFEANENLKNDIQELILKEVLSEIVKENLGKKYNLVLDTKFQIIAGTEVFSIYGYKNKIKFSKEEIENIIINLKETLLNEITEDFILIIKNKIKGKYSGIYFFGMNKDMLVDALIDKYIYSCSNYEMASCEILDFYFENIDFYCIKKFILSLRYNNYKIVLY